MIVKCLFVILQILFFFEMTYMYSMPAYPKKIPVKSGEDILWIRLFGDEKNKRAESLDGYTIIQKNGEWFYAEKGNDELLKPSGHRLSTSISSETQQFLRGISKHLTNKKTLNGAQYGRTKPQILNRTKAKGTRRVLVILMQYKNLSMIKSQTAFDKLFNGVNYSEDGAQGSVCDFYTDVSYGQLQLTCDVIGPFTSKNAQSYYGGNNRSGDDSHPEVLFEEAITQAARTVNLKEYDANNDGYVDNIHIIFAGHGEEAGASDDAIWSHEASFYQPYEIQGMKIDRYSCAPELRGNSGNGISRIGPHCHEIGHALGAMDYYDTDYQTGDEYVGTGDWDVMASGSWNNDGISPADFNPYVKANDFGWIIPKSLPAGKVSIGKSCNDPDNYFILKSEYSTDYYLLENRSSEKWGYGVPGEGLLVFHIHPDILDSENNINASSPQKCYIVCASSRNRLPGNTSSSYGNINSEGCPYPGSSNNTDFGQSSIPKAFFWDDVECEIELNDISMDKGGVIHLYNNSISSDGIDRERIFYEDFEGETIKIEIMKDEDYTSLPSWVIENNPEGPSKFITRPYAYKGTKCLQLSAKKIADNVTSMFSFSMPEINGEGILRISLYVNTLNPLYDNPNIIRAYYRMKGSDEWQYKEVESSDNNRWQQCYMELPIVIENQIQIEGIAHSGSVLAIDNLELELISENNETNIKNYRIHNDNEESIYTISGARIYKKQHGINIIRMSDGTTRKVIHR